MRSEVVVPIFVSREGEPRCCESMVQKIIEIGDADVLLCAEAIRDELSRIKNEALSCCITQRRSQDIDSPRSTSPCPDDESDGWVDLANEARPVSSTQPGGGGRTRKFASRSS